jgi:hypothetical protein
MMDNTYFIFEDNELPDRGSPPGLSCKKVYFSHKIGGKLWSLSIKVNISIENNPEQLSRRV